MRADLAPVRRQTAKFLWLYALAWAGGAVAYVPFLTILLPVRVAELTPGTEVQWLAYMTFCGALSASISAILFGWLSDRSGKRRPWVLGGLALTTGISLTIGLARDPLSLLLLIVLWQMALNMMLGPLAAWAADHVPRNQLGSLGGLLAFSPALGSAATAFVTLPGLADWNGQMRLVAALVAICVLPALLLGRPVVSSAPASVTENSLDIQVDGPAPARNLAAAMWFARFLVQISEAALFAYLYYFFRSVDPRFDAAWVARLCMVVLMVSVPVALIVGRWSDRRSRPVLPLTIAASVAAMSLLAMAAAQVPEQAVSAYVFFGLASTIFLSLHSAQTFRVLRRGNRRGRDLGLFNLTNTVPSLIMPWLTIAIVPSFGFSHLFVLLAALAGTSALLLFSIASRLRRT